MEFLKLAESRYSVRKYSDRPVEKEKIDRCIEAARLAPSACNAQPWKFIVVDRPDMKEKAAKATFGKLISFNHFSLKAPVMVVVTAEPPNLTSGAGAVIKNLPYYLIDIGIAAEHFCLQAVEEGLGTCMIGWFDEKELKKLLTIPKARKIALVITLGYPEPRAEGIPGKLRKPLPDMSSYNQY